MLLGNLAHEWVPGVQPPANLKEAIEGSYPADAATRALSPYFCALLVTAFDVRMMSRGGVAAATRLTRHLLRMCLGMFRTTASLFLGQPKVFPMAIRHSGLLPVPVLLVVAAVVYWLVRIRLWPRLRRVRSARAAAARTVGAV